MSETEKGDFDSKEAENDKIVIEELGLGIETDKMIVEELKNYKIGLMSAKVLGKPKKIQKDKLISAKVMSKPSVIKIKFSDFISNKRPTLDSEANRLEYFNGTKLIDMPLHEIHPNLSKYLNDRLPRSEWEEAILKTKKQLIDAGRI